MLLRTLLDLYGSGLRKCALRFDLVWRLSSQRIILIGEGIVRLCGILIFLAILKISLTILKWVKNMTSSLTQAAH